MNLYNPVPENDRVIKRNKNNNTDSNAAKYEYEEYRIMPH